MKILAIDPGHTIGYAVLENFELIITGQLELDVSNFNVAIDVLLSEIQQLLYLHNPNIIVLEDYRVYASTAKVFINSRNTTSEIIGALEMMGSYEGLSVTRLPASCKNMWPTARLRQWFPNTLEAMSPTKKPHAYDAWLIGISYVEKTQPNKPFAETRAEENYLARKDYENSL